MPPTVTRPVRIIGVVAATALLIGSAGAGVVAIQGLATPAVASADGPMVSGSIASGSLDSAALASATKVLGPIGTTKLPSIKKAVRQATVSLTPVSVTPVVATANRKAGEEHEEHESD